MNIYMVTVTEKPAAAEQAIARTFPGDFMPVTPGSWFVAGYGTALEICGRLGLPTAPGGTPPAFSAVVTLVTGYFGYAPTNLWEWLASKQSQQLPSTASATSGAGA